MMSPDRKAAVDAETQRILAAAEAGKLYRDERAGWQIVGQPAPQREQRQMLFARVWLRTGRFADAFLTDAGRRALRDLEDRDRARRPG